MRSPRLSLPVLALLALTASCRGGGGESSPERRTLIDSRDTEDPRSLDPALTTDVPTGRAVAYLFDGLTRFTPDGSLAPALAARWEVSEDGLRYVFHLRQGVRFHDGTPFRASQVVCSFHRVLESATRGGRPWPLYPISGARSYADGRARSVTGLTAVDDSTLHITLDTALAIFPKLMAMPVASVVPDSIPADFGQRPIGTGPWKLAEWRHDDYLLFARNDAYFDGPPEADSLMARIIPEPSTAVAEFESGNVDVLYVPEAETPQWEADAGKRALLTSAPALRLWYVAINTRRGPLADARVRRALNHAVDVRTILERLIGGRGRLAAGVIPPGLEGMDSTRSPYAFDQARARQLLAEAGYAGGIDVEIWHSTVPAFARVAQSIQAYLGQVNVRARIVQRDAPSVREASRNGQVDLIVKDWIADYPDAENFLYPLLHGSNHGVGGNVSFYSNPAFDRLVSSARVEQDSTRRAALYRQADSLSFEEAPMIYLLFYNDLLAVQPWVRGFRVPAIFTGQRWTDVTMTR
ncbi:MAG: ABC transporter substrate-binding protein [Gemmatimonadaceae bacterium]